MFKIIQNFNWLVVSAILCIFLGIITFLTFINQGFIPLTEANLLILLTVDILLLVIFFFLIFRNIIRFYRIEKSYKKGTKTNLKYVSLFSLFTFIPSLLVAVFSLFLFNFGVQKFFNDQIKIAVNNSYDVAKNYQEESKKTVKSDVILMSVGINRVSELFYTNLNKFKRVVLSEKLLRRIDDVYLIDSSGNIMFSDTSDPNIKFIIPSEDNFNKAFDGFPVSILNSIDNKASVMIKLNSLIDTFLYISRNIDPEILKYLNETEQAVNFYYSVENKRTGIKVTFAIIYIIIVTLMLFLSTVIAMTFAQRLTKPIINLIKASDSISKGDLNTQVSNVESDDDFKLLNLTFNNMIKRLKKQQDKLLIAERYSAWESVARKLAHEIKNPLTPIQLSIDRLREKYSSKISDNQEDFNNYLTTINRQIKDIEKLTNEFSSFARMPSPIMKKIDIHLCVKRAVDFINMSSSFLVNLKNINKKVFVNADEEQLYRVFINLIKNSQESIEQKKQNNHDFKGKIDIEIELNNDYTVIKLKDNGTGISDTKQIMTPYFTTKKTGTGLGLPIVDKIINEHLGDLIISNNKLEGVEVVISLPIFNEK